MIIPDINLLVYAYNANAPHHGRARAWWEEALSGTRTVGLPWVLCLGFTRIMTNRRILINPMTAIETLQHVRSWCALPQTELIQPGPRHLDILDSFARAGTLVSELITDAHIAALAVEFQAEVHSNDNDFSRFPGLRWKNPLD